MYAAIFAIVIVLLLMWVFFQPVSKTNLVVLAPGAATATTPATPAVAVAVPSGATTEQMIAAMNIARMSRGYNGVNTGGTYDDSMNQLSEAEKMSLATVEVGPKFL